MKTRKASSRRLTLGLTVFAASVLLLCGVGSASDSGQSPTPEGFPEPPKRKLLADMIPKHLPIKVKVKNLDEDKWAREFALEVTNTSDKPIYYLQFYLYMPEVISPNGRRTGFPLRYGRKELISLTAPLSPDDLPILPGEKYVFKIDGKNARGWENLKKNENKPEPKKFELIFVQLNFGDGTGFTGTDARGMNIHKKRATSGLFMREHGVDNIDKVKVFVEFIVFDDDTAWNKGHVMRRDPSNPVKWIPLARPEKRKRLKPEWAFSIGDKS